MMCHHIFIFNNIAIFFESWLRLSTVDLILEKGFRILNLRKIKDIQMAEILINYIIASMKLSNT